MEQLHLNSTDAKIYSSRNNQSKTPTTKIPFSRWNLQFKGQNIQLGLWCPSNWVVIAYVSCMLFLGLGITT